MLILKQTQAIIQVGDTTLPVEDFEIDCQPVCPHPELNMMLGTWPRDERIYWCSACKKKISIPMWQASFSDHNAQENLAGIIELTFGEQWGNLAREGKI